MAEVKKQDAQEMLAAEMIKAGVLERKTGIAAITAKTMGGNQFETHPEKMTPAFAEQLDKKFGQAGRDMKEALGMSSLEGWNANTLKGQLETIGKAVSGKSMLKEVEGAATAVAEAAQSGPSKLAAAQAQADKLMKSGAGSSFREVEIMKADGGLPTTGRANGHDTGKGGGRG